MTYEGNDSKQPINRGLESLGHTPNAAAPR
jgi:hypothetical protein